MGKPFLTVEDLKLTFSLFCYIYGIGTLSMPKNYARAGFLWATIALLFMAAANIYATLCISKILLVAPKRVRTFADLGEFCMGKFGRWSIFITQMLTCFLGPIVYLVLGGSILEIIFPNSYGEVTWIILMGFSLLPVALIPTMKEGAFAAAAGALGTILADGIALYLLVSNMTPIPDGLKTPKPDVNFGDVASVFGSLAFAYSPGIVIPALQREHSEPSRMPRVILVTLGIISVLFLTVAITGVSFVGCQIPGNLLFSVAGAPTALGFTANRGGVILACLFMQLHITIAYAVTSNPMFHMLEQIIFGLHKQPAITDEEGGAFGAITTPQDNATTEKGIEQVDSVIVNEDHERDAQTYRQPGVYPKIAAMRIVVVAASVTLACVWKNHMSDVLDFTGASCIALCCMILPIVFYLKVFGRTNKVGKLEWVFAVVVVLITIFLGVHETYQSAKPLFNPQPAAANAGSWDAVKFAYCPAGSSYQRMVYTNVSFHANYTGPVGL
ncbi:unnamed protein product [Aphanomyces euteiches]